MDLSPQILAKSAKVAAGKTGVDALLDAALTATLENISGINGRSGPNSPSSGASASSPQMQMPDPAPTKSYDCDMDM